MKKILINQEKAKETREKNRRGDGISDLPYSTEQKIEIRHWVDKMPENCRASYLKAMVGKSKVAAIKAKCIECQGWQKAEVSRCDIITCALYPYRPFRNKSNGDSGEKET